MSFTNIRQDPDIPQMKIFETSEDENLKHKITIVIFSLLFGLLWILAFVRATTTFIVMYSASTYYFSSDATREGKAQVHAGIRISFKKFGSLAFGSFILATITFIKLVFIQAAKQAEKASGDNGVVKSVNRCGECIL